MNASKPEGCTEHATVIAGKFANIHTQCPVHPGADHVNGIRISR